MALVMMALTLHLPDATAVSLPVPSTRPAPTEGGSSSFAAVLGFTNSRALAMQQFACGISAGETLTGQLSADIARDPLTVPAVGSRPTQPPSGIDASTIASEILAKPIGAPTGTVLPSTLKEATGLLGIAPEEPARERQSAAEVFDADGLLGRMQVETASIEGTMPDVAVAPTIFLSVRALPINQNAKATASAGLETTQAATASMPMPSAAAHCSVPVILNMSSVAGGTSPSTAPLRSTTGDPGEEIAGPKTSLPRTRPQQACAASVAVAVQELASGIQVVARLGELDPAKRLQLRDEIAALLARHGLSADTITVVARAPLNSRQGDF